MLAGVGSGRGITVIMRIKFPIHGVVQYLYYAWVGITGYRYQNPSKLDVFLEL